MCRWNAYFGQPVLIDELLFRTEHSLIDQSLHSRMGVETTNGDGFGLGWYSAGNGGTPARYRSVTPAWSDQNLRDLASHVESPLFLAHIRATTGTPVQQTNCHPFRHGRWLFVHNGVINGFQAMRRDLLYAVDASLFDGVHGSTDSEALFYLALTFGLEADPIGAVERAVGFVEATAEAHRIEHPVQMTLGFSDGERLYAVRYSTEHRSRTLFVSEDVAAVRALHPDNPRFQRMTDEDRVVVSEPVLLGPRIATRRSPRTVVQIGLLAASVTIVLLATLDVTLNDTGFKVALALIGAVLLGSLATGVSERITTNPDIPAAARETIVANVEEGIDIVPVAAQLDALRLSLGTVALAAQLSLSLTRGLPTSSLAESKALPRANGSRLGQRSST